MYFFHISASSSRNEMQLTGVYNLVAVVAHRGRALNVGHYVAFVKKGYGQYILDHLI